MRGVNIKPAWFSGLLMAAFLVVAFPACKDSEETLARSYRSEVKSNLRAISVLQETCFSERATYCGTFDLMDFNPSGPTRYSYFLPGDRIEAEKGGPYNLPTSIKPEVSEKGYRVVAVGNIDSDPVLDVWTVDEKPGVKNVRDDLKN